MFYLVCFDISDDPTRARVVKVLKGHGYRVQKSVFECPDLTEKRFLKLKDRLEGLVDMTTDSIRFYRQCRGCLKDFEFTGIGTPPELDRYAIF
ncbi:MAG: CRISPR-associated endonuclease Cas2 [Desulfovibrionales bacterium]|nr:MAG: CRISPR-associated endonuclease Cas2 [Desulfovibrionales bacterium]